MRRLFVVSLLSTFAVLPVWGQGLTLGEHYTLRSYTGKAMGNVFSASLKFNSLHVVTNNTSVCGSLVGAIGSSYVDLEGRRRMQVTVLNSPEEAQNLNPATEAVALIFGGQASPEVNYNLTKSSLKRLADAKYNGAIFFHLRVWAPKFVERASQEDPAIAQYLANKENLYTVTADLSNKVIRLWQVSVKDGKQATVKELGTMPLNPIWEDLLRRSL
ncbi:MAG: hypothetical protein RMK75_06335 [Aquificaceae bacterium]|nr:hypothetical protein [Aquificaceae bacterium]MDW8423922.1 hypothetical protein [Aquificaceae bacterium]